MKATLTPQRLTFAIAVCITCMICLTRLSMAAGQVFNGLALLFGIIVGTLSSIFVASQIWLEIEKRSNKKGKKDKKMWYEAEDDVNELEIKGINS